MRKKFSCAPLQQFCWYPWGMRKPRLLRRQREQSIVKTDTDKLSYSIGMNIGSGFKAQSIEVNTDMLVRGVQDALKGTKPLMTEEEMKATLTALQGQLQAKQAAKMEKAAGDNKAKGDVFLAANKAKEGVVALPSGLQYKVLKPGTGPKPKETDAMRRTTKAH